MHCYHMYEQDVQAFRGGIFELNFRKRPNHGKHVARTALFRFLVELV